MSVSPELFKQVLSRFCTGVTIVTVKNKSGAHGLTVNAFTSVSLDPPLILVCIDKGGNSHEFMSVCDFFVVNILSEEQTELANRFADPDLTSEQRFENASVQLTQRGIPIFDDNLGHLECRNVQQVDGGDHTIFIGQVEDANFSEERSPLLYYKSRFYNIYT